MSDSMLIVIRHERFIIIEWEPPKKASVELIRSKTRSEKDAKKRSGVLGIDGEKHPKDPIRSGKDDLGPKRRQRMITVNVIVCTTYPWY